MKRNTIFRTSDKKGAKGYTPISNNILQSKTLSIEDAGLLGYLLSLPVDFTIVQKNVIKQLKGRISSGRLRSSWKSLVAKGYIVKFVYHKNNLRREGWRVYENPEIRECGNRDSRETTPLQSKKEQNKKIENKEIENTNTSTSILGEKIEIDKNKISIPDSCFIEARNEAIQQLTGATVIKEEILLYTSPEKNQQLLDRIGNIQFDLIFDQLEKYQFAIRQLEKNNSSSTGEVLEPE